MEKNKILEILNDWNFWDKKFYDTKNRSYYEKTLNLFDNTNEITVLKGIRRSGKSTLLINHIQNLLGKNININQILFINFEDPRFIENLNVSLLDEIFEVYKEYINDSNDEIYVFLDEIQYLNGWEKWVRTKYDLRQVKKFYVTGSSSKLLSREFGTSLSGRFLDINVFPLSFKEFLEFKDFKFFNNIDLITRKIEVKKLFNQYFKQGGFPKVILSHKELQKKEILNYYETIILKDIVARYNLKNANNVRKVAYYLISNLGKPISLNNIKTSLNISYDLVENYYNYLKEVYLLFNISKYDSSLKKQFFSQKKTYSIDLSFNHHIGFKFSEDYGRLLENIVFIELKRRGKEIYYHKQKKECDFVIKQGLKIVSAIQVTKILSDKETKKREFDGLIESMQSYNLKEGLILTEDEEFEELVKDKHGKEYKVVVKPVWKWLLE